VLLINEEQKEIKPQIVGIEITSKECTRRIRALQ
jgi:hypothetical protein